MDDARIWAFEQSLWTADPGHYHRSIDREGLLVVPAEPYILGGEAAADAMAETPRWAEVAFSRQQVRRPQEGLIVIAYRVDARRGGQAYAAHCSSVYRRLAEGEWQVVQHQQTPLLEVPARAAG